MKKLSMISQVSITFEEGCNRYILNCKQRNLRQGTINHYKQSYTQFYKYFDREMLLSEITEQTYKDQLYTYNKARGVKTTGIHRYRHTFAKQWILNGGNVVALQKILGHSNLAITQNYINMLVSETAEEVNTINLLCCQYLLT